MSSNPFRRSRVIQPAQPALSDDGQQEYNIDARPEATPPLQSKPKRVQIQTPPHSPEDQFVPEDGNRRLSATAGRTNSPPPPPITVTADDAEANVLTTSDSGLLQAQVNAQRNSAGFEPPSTIASSQSSTRAPYNPFARTLATSEASYGPTSGESEEAELEQYRSGGKPTMDVDMFKSILLTGSAPPPAAFGTASAPVLPRSQGSSSGTDTLSLSRQSLFDSAHEHRSQSPQTSFDDYESASSEDDAYENESSSLMGPNRPQEIAPRAPPKPKNKGPQTVSFADFDQSIPSTFSSSGPRTPPATQSVSGILRVSPSRSPSDLNKPLPPAPIARSSTSEKGPLSQRPASIRRTSEEASQPKKVPPPPPASRRQAAATTTSIKTAVPPRNISNPSPNPSATDTTADSASDTSSTSSQETPRLPRPPPPPSRKAQAPTPPPPRSISTKSSLTNPSTSSRSSIDIPRPQDPLSTSSPNSSTQALASVPAPPVPPHRRGGGGGGGGGGEGGGGAGSKRTSIDGGRPGSLREMLRDEEGERIERGSGQGEGGSSVGGGGGGGEGESPRDLLADMTAFQAEIDALRARAGGSG